MQVDGKYKHILIQIQIYVIIFAFLLAVDLIDGFVVLLRVESYLLPLFSKADVLVKIKSEEVCLRPAKIEHDFLVEAVVKALVFLLKLRKGDVHQMATKVASKL